MAWWEYESDALPPWLVGAMAKPKWTPLPLPSNAPAWMKEAATRQPVGTPTPKPTKTPRPTRTPTAPPPTPPLMPTVPLATIPPPTLDPAAQAREAMGPIMTPVPPRAVPLVYSPEYWETRYTVPWAPVTKTGYSYERVPPWVQPMRWLEPFTPAPVWPSVRSASPAGQAARMHQAMTQVPEPLKYAQWIGQEAWENIQRKGEAPKGYVRPEQTLREYWAPYAEMAKGQPSTVQAGVALTAAPGLVSRAWTELGIGSPGSAGVLGSGFQAIQEPAYAVERTLGGAYLAAHPKAQKLTAEQRYQLAREGYSWMYNAAKTYGRANVMRYVAAKARGEPAEVPEDHELAQAVAELRAGEVADKVVNRYYKLGAELAGQMLLDPLNLIGGSPSKVRPRDAERALQLAATAVNDLPKGAQGRAAKRIGTLARLFQEQAAREAEAAAKGIAELAGRPPHPSTIREIANAFVHVADPLPFANASRNASEAWLVLAPAISETRSPEDALRLLKLWRENSPELAQFMGGVTRSEAGQVAQQILQKIGDRIRQAPSLRAEGLDVAQVAMEGVEAAQKPKWNPARFMLDLDEMMADELALAYRVPQGQRGALGRFVQAQKRFMSELYLDPLISPSYAVMQTGPETSAMAVDGIKPFSNRAQEAKDWERLGVGTRRRETQGVERAGLGGKEQLTGIPETLKRGARGEMAAEAEALPGPFRKQRQAGMEFARRGKVRIPGTETEILAGEEARYDHILIEAWKRWQAQNGLRSMPPPSEEMVRLLGPELSDLLRRVAANGWTLAEKRAEVQALLNARKAGEMVNVADYIDPNLMNSVEPAMVRLVEQELKKLGPDATLADAERVIRQVEQRIITDTNQRYARMAERQLELTDAPRRSPQEMAEELSREAQLRVTTATDEAELVDEAAGDIRDAAKMAGTPEAAQAGENLARQVETVNREVDAARAEMIAAAGEADQDALWVLVQANRDAEKMRIEGRMAADEMSRAVRVAYQDIHKAGLTLPDGTHIVHGELWDFYFPWRARMELEGAARRAERFRQAAQQIGEVRAGRPVSEVLGKTPAEMSQALLRAADEVEVLKAPPGFVPESVMDARENEHFDALVASKRSEVDAASARAWRASFLVPPQFQGRTVDLLDSTMRDVELYGRVAAGKRDRALETLRKELERLRGNSLSIRQAKEDYYELRNDIWREFFDKAKLRWERMEADALLHDFGPHVGTMPPQAGGAAVDAAQAAVEGEPESAYRALQREALELFGQNKDPRKWTEEERALVERWQDAVSQRMGKAPAEKLEPAQAAEKARVTRQAVVDTLAGWERPMSQQQRDDFMTLMDAHAGMWEAWMHRPAAEYWDWALGEIRNQKWADVQRRQWMMSQAGARRRWYYSQLQRVIEQKMGGRADPKQIAGMVKGVVKPDELEWTGFNRWLGEQKGPVTKEDVLAYLAENQVEVREVAMGRGVARATAEQIAEANSDGAITEWALDNMPGAVSRELMDYGDEGRGIYDLVLDEQRVADSGEFIVDLDGTVLHRNLVKDLTPGGPVRYGPDTYPSLNLPGGKGYRELILTWGQPESAESVLAREGWTVKQLPNRDWVLLDAGGGELDRADNWNTLISRNEHWGVPAPKYTSTHWPNVENPLAHVRFDERVDADGKRVVFVQEYQNDYAERLREAAQGRARQEGLVEDSPEFKKRVSALVKNPKELGWPDLPFKTTDAWMELIFKRTLDWAAQNGFDRVAWTTGAQQNERYNLAAVVDRLMYQPSTGQLVGNRGGANVFSQKVSAEKLAETVGKEPAAQLMAAAPDWQGYRMIEGEDLRVGGHGMTAFYDQMLPLAAERVTKKWGGKVGETSFATSPYGLDVAANRYGQYNVLDYSRNIVFTGTEQEARAWAKAHGELPATVHSLDITPQMRAGIQAEGFPLFQRSPFEDTEEFRGWFGTPDPVVIKGNKPKTWFHGTPKPGFTEFSPAKRDPWALYGPGYYFTDSPEVAGGWYEMEKIHTHYPTEAEARAVPNQVWFNWKEDYGPHAGEWVAVTEKPKRVRAGYADVRDWPNAQSQAEIDAITSAIEKSDDWQRAFAEYSSLTDYEKRDIAYFMDAFKHSGRYNDLSPLTGQPYNIDIPTILERAGYGLGTGAVYEVYLNPKHLFDINAPSNDRTATEIAKGLERLYEKSSEVYEGKRLTAALKAAGLDEGQIAWISNNWSKGGRDLARSVAPDVVEEVERQAEVILRGPHLRPGAAAEFRQMLISSPGRTMTNDDIFSNLKNVLFRYTIGGEDAHRWMIPEVLEEAGYDGITHIGGAITGGEPHRVVIAFHPEQVKSVANTGAFGPVKNMLFQPGISRAARRGVPVPEGVLTQAETARLEALRAKVDDWADAIGDLTRKGPRPPRVTPEEAAELEALEARAGGGMEGWQVGGALPGEGPARAALPAAPARPEVPAAPAPEPARPRTEFPSRPMTVAPEAPPGSVGSVAAKPVQPKGAQQVLPGWGPATGREARLERARAALRQALADNGADADWLITEIDQGGLVSIPVHDMEGRLVKVDYAFSGSGMRAEDSAALNKARVELQEYQNARRMVEWERAGERFAVQPPGGMQYALPMRPEIPTAAELGLSEDEAARLGHLATLSYNDFRMAGRNEAHRAALRDEFLTLFAKAKAHDAAKAQSMVRAHAPQWVVPTLQQATPGAPRGVFTFGPDLRAVLTFLEGADITTPPHEMMGHLFLQDLWRMSQIPGADVLADDLRAVEKWAGLGEGEYGRIALLYANFPADPQAQARYIAEHGADIDRWLAAHEKFAELPGIYLAEGRAPTEELAGVFERFKEWLRQWWQAITGKGLDEKVPDEMRAVLDRMLARPEEVAKWASSAGNRGRWDDAFGLVQRYKLRVPTSLDDAIALYRMEMGPGPGVDWDWLIARFEEEGERHSRLSEAMHVNAAVERKAFGGYEEIPDFREGSQPDVVATERTMKARVRNISKEDQRELKSKMLEGLTYAEHDALANWYGSLWTAARAQKEGIPYKLRKLAPKFVRAQREQLIVDAAKVGFPLEAADNVSDDALRVLKQRALDEKAGLMMFQPAAPKFPAMRTYPGTGPRRSTDQLEYVRHLGLPDDYYIWLSGDNFGGGRWAINPDYQSAEQLRALERYDRARRGGEVGERLKQLGKDAEQARLADEDALRATGKLPPPPASWQSPSGTSAPKKPWAPPAPKPKQVGMWEQGEETPLFSGAAQAWQEPKFQPPPVTKQVGLPGIEEAPAMTVEALRFKEQAKVGARVVTPDGEGVVRMIGPSQSLVAFPDPGRPMKQYANTALRLVEEAPPAEVSKPTQLMMFQRGVDRPWMERPGDVRGPERFYEPGAAPEYVVLGRKAAYRAVKGLPVDVSAQDIEDMIQVATWTMFDQLEKGRANDYAYAAAVTQAKRYYWKRGVAKGPLNFLEESLDVPVLEGDATLADTIPAPEIEEGVISWLDKYSDEQIKAILNRGYQAVERKRVNLGHAGDRAEKDLKTLRMIAAGYDNTEMARELGIGYGPLQARRKRLQEVLQALAPDVDVDMAAYRKAMAKRGAEVSATLKRRGRYAGAPMIYQPAAPTGADRMAHFAWMEQPGAANRPAVEDLIRAAEEANRQAIEQVLVGVRRDWGRIQPVAANEAQKRAVWDWFNRAVSPAFMQNKAAGMAYAQYIADTAQLDYSQMRGGDLLLSHAIPYHYWYTRASRNWALRVMRRPGLMAQYLRVRDAMKLANENAGRRARFGESFRIPAPWLPEWMGGGLYVDPSRTVYTLASLYDYNWDDADDSATGFRKLMQLGRSLGMRPFPSWEVPFQLGALLRAAKTTGMTDEQAERFAGPPRPGEVGYYVPQTGQLKAVTAMAREAFPALANTKVWTPWGERMLIPPGGVVGPEEAGRAFLNLPRGDIWDPYRVIRMLANIPADEAPGDRNAAVVASDAQELIKRDLDQRGRVWEPGSELAQQVAAEFNWTPERLARAQEMAAKAINRAAVESGVRTIGRTLGVGLSVEPAGEKKQLELQRQARQTMWSPANPTGSYAAYRAFKEAHPEIYPRMAQYQVVPGEESQGMTPGARANWLLMVPERDRINREYDARIEKLLKFRPWDTAGASRLDNERWALLRGAGKLEGTGGLLAKYPIPESQGQIPAVLSGMSPDEQGNALAEEEIGKFMAQKPQPVEDFQGNVDWPTYYASVDAWRSRLPATTPGLQAAQAVGGKYKGLTLPEAVQAWEQRNTSPIEAAADVYEKAIADPAMVAYKQVQNQTYTGYGGKQYHYSTEAARQATLGQVPRMEARELIGEILARYPYRGWTPAQLEQALQGMVFPPMLEWYLQKNAETYDLPKWKGPVRTPIQERRAWAPPMMTPP